MNGSVQSNQKSFEKISPPFEVDHFSRLDWSDRNRPFYLTISTHSQSQDFAVRYHPCTKWRKILITAILCQSICVTRTSMSSYYGSVAASLPKSMFWLLTALKDDLFPKRIWNGVYIIRFERGVWSQMANIWERSAQNNPLYWLNYYGWSSSHNIIHITVKILI